MSSQMDVKALLEKYDVPVPRYTSYPTVPAWSTTPTLDEWVHDVKISLQKDSASWSMYLHIPFCETLCTFCGCNTTITKDHAQETPYVDLLIKEFGLYLDRIPELKTKPLRHIHLGGGTPTFLSARELTRLCEGLLAQVTVSKVDFEASIEVDPRRTRKDQLQALKSMGFNRVSLGVQDFNERVQKLINRIQPFAQTQEISETARSLGYDSVNFDLIYGLPAQDMQSLEATVDFTTQLRPDRIAFYSFALVPWIKPAQRLFKDSDLPDAENKRALYERAREKFLKAGYEEVGMDHFALPHDSLLKARTQGHLHRNFMGYADKHTDVMIGLGVSSISESSRIFHQNEKLLPKYQERVTKGEIPTFRGHKLSEREALQRSKILQLMTKLDIRPHELEPTAELQEFINEGLITVRGDHLSMTEKGRPFLRNVCALFDDHFQAQVRHKSQLFSKSI